jgi:hypothetical protein
MSTPRSGTKTVPTRERGNEDFPGDEAFGLEIGKLLPTGHKPQGANH